MNTLHAGALLAIALIAGCGGTRAPFRQLDATSTQAYAPSNKLVAEHALRGAMIRDAVERGDLRGTRQAANGLVELVTKHEVPAPESRFEAMVDAARSVAAAQSLHEGATSFAMLAERCGECHAQIGGPKSFPASAPVDATGVIPRMRRHHWGAARLWEGLVAPSNEAWRSGAEVLSAAPLRPELVAGETVAPEVDALAVSVHDLGVQAAAATQASSRVAIYGELLTTCATCHERVHGRSP